MARVVTISLIAVAFLIGLIGLLAAAASSPGSDPPASASAGVSSHKVDLLWKPDAQDIAPGTGTVLDSFDSFGPPFGNDKPVETKTPRSQIGTDTRSGKWEVTVRPAKNPKQCTGTFELDRDVIETTPTSQTVEFDGAVKIKDCDGLRKFRHLRPGRLGHLKGESFCTANGCRGGLKIKGKVRY